MATKSAPKSEPADKEDSDSKTSKKSKLKPVLLIVAILFAMAGTGAGGWYMSHKSAAKAEAADADTEAENEDESDSENQAKTKAKGKAAKGKSDQAKPPIFANLDAFTVNLQRDETDHYLQVTLVLKVGETSTVDAVKPYTPQLRNNILLLLSSKRAKDLESTEAKQKLASEITAIAKMSVTPAIAEDISGVFFTTFLIQ